MYTLWAFLPLTLSCSSLPVVECDCCSLPQVAKQWYDYDRKSFHFVKIAREFKAPLTFRRVSDFDENGIVYWIGTNAK